jgi:hypothetical protein
MTKHEIKNDFIQKMEKCQKFYAALDLKHRASGVNLRKEIFLIIVEKVMADYKNELKYITEFLQDGFCVRIGKYDAVETLEDFAIIISEAYSK